MKKNPLLLIVLGLTLLGVGAFMQFAGGAPKADPVLVQRCQAEMNARGAEADMVKQCTETAFATAMTATDATAAAQSISAANTSEIGSNALAMFLIGLGLVLTLGGIVLRQKQKA